MTADGVLQGRRVLVTGASSGIGEAVARAVVAAAGSVALVARRAERIEALAAELGGRSVAAPGDVTDHDGIVEVVATAAHRLGGLDAIVNAAGVMQHGSPADTDPERWRATYDVNVLGLLAATRAAMPHLRQADGPSIVNVSSMSGRRVASPEAGAYAASKFAVHALGDALRLDVQAEGVRVTTISPGFVDTPLTDDWDDQEAAATWRAAATTKGLQPEDVAAAVVHVLSLPPSVTVVEYALTATKQVPGGR